MLQEAETNFYKTERATVEDIAQILEVKALSWLDTYLDEERGISKADIERHVSKSLNGDPELVEKKTEQLLHPPTKSACWIVRDNGLVVGYVWPVVEKSGRNRVGGLYLRPEYKGKGIGTILMSEVINFFKGEDIYLEVAHNNVGAIGFYKKLGFNFTGAEKDFQLGHTGKSLKTKEMLLKGKS